MIFIYRYPAGSFGTISKRIACGSFANTIYPLDFLWRNTPKCKKEMDILTEMKEPRTMFPRSRQVCEIVDRGGWLRNVFGDPFNRAKITPISRSGKKGNSEFHFALLFRTVILARETLMKNLIRVIYQRSILKWWTLLQLQNLEFMDVLFDLLYQNIKF